MHCDTLDSIQCPFLSLMKNNCVCEAQGDLAFGMKTMESPKNHTENYDRHAKTIVDSIANRTISAFFYEVKSSIANCHHAIPSYQMPATSVMASHCWKHAKWKKVLKRKITLGATPLSQRGGLSNSTWSFNCYSWPWRFLKHGPAHRLLKAFPKVQPPSSRLTNLSHIARQGRRNPVVSNVMDTTKLTAYQSSSIGALASLANQSSKHEKWIVCGIAHRTATYSNASNGRLEQVNIPTIQSTTLINTIRKINRQLSVMVLGAPGQGQRHRGWSDFLRLPALYFCTYIPDLFPRIVAMRIGPGRFQMNLRQFATFTLKRANHHRPS